MTTHVSATNVFIDFPPYKQTHLHLTLRNPITFKPEVRLRECVENRFSDNNIFFTCRKCITASYPFRYYTQVITF